jgi:putative oxidoreductase
MLEKLFNTDSRDTSALVARVFLGVVILPHGLQKLLGMFGGYGFSATVEFFSGMCIPSAIGALIVLGESFGALFLILGFLSRISAAAIGIIMLGSIVMVHAQNGFFMNWFGTQAGEGYEYHLLALGLSAALIISGGGRLSLDHLIAKRFIE